jgi:PKD repeat protein
MSGLMAISWGGQALAEVTIDRADWDGRTLTVSGSGDNRDTVTLTNAYDSTQVLGTRDIGRRGAWRIRDWRPSPVPCAVAASDQNSKRVVLDVQNAPGDCDPAAPGGGHTPPTASANGPYSGTVGVAVQLSSAGSNDPDGNIVAYAWDFGDGSTSSAANPSHAYVSAGTYNVTLTVTDNDGATGADSTLASITAVPPPNEPPTANANGPYAGTVGVAVQLSSAGSNDPDGNIVAYAWDFGDGNTSTAADPSHTYGSADTYTVSLTVTDNEGASDSATTAATISDPVACTSPIQEHCQITAYTGPEVCVECHEGEARDMHGSVHYQQGGAFPNVTNIPTDFAAAGERPAKAAGDLVATGINTYCGTHENSPRFTCAGCHVGNGRFPMAQSQFEKLKPASVEAHTQLANIDCLMCHQEAYKRFPDWTASGEGFEDFELLNLVELPDGSLEQSNGDVLPRTGYSGIPTVNPDTLDFQFLPAGRDTLPASVPMAPMALTTLEAAQNVHATTRKSCLTCHAGAAGGDGTKRGDLSKENADPSLAIDMHMSSAGQNLTCSDCHNETLSDGTGHRLRGRGLDLRPNDTPDRFTCENSGCHSDQPHGDYSSRTGSSRDKHAQKVACQTCHIPSYAKADVGTEVARDWQDPHPSAAACNGRGGWLPREDKGGLGSASLTPSYEWFDGTSEIYYLGEPLDGVPTIPLDANIAASFVGNFNAGDPAYVIGMPNGDVTSTSLGTKLYPMKEHWGKLARNDADNTLIGHSTFEFFRTGSFCRAVAVGLGLDEVNAPKSSVCDGIPGDTADMPPNTTVVPVHTYQTINHGVEPSDDALGCNDCHGSNARIDLEGDLGYELKAPESQVCTQCHDNKGSMSFNKIHDKHVKDKGRDCSVCHTFSRPERGLSTRISD